MPERPTTCPNGHALEWLQGMTTDGEQFTYGRCAGALCPPWELTDGELWPGGFSDVMLPEERWYRATIRAERQARAAAETQATYWQREQATADAKWKELQTALRAERQARQAAEARAAKLEEMLRHIATISAKPHLRKKAAVIEYCVNQAIDTDPSPLLALVEAARQLDVAQTFDALMIAAHSVKAALAKLDGVAS